MAKAKTSDVLVLPKGSKRTGSPASGRRDKRVTESLGEVWAAIAGGTPISEVVEMIFGRLAENYGIAEMVLISCSESVRATIPWAAYGVSEERSKEIIKLLGAEQNPEGLLSKTLQDRFKVSANGYFIPEEEWLSLVQTFPFGDSPSYYRHPERLGQPRKDLDEWREGDLYRFVVRGVSGDLLAAVELAYSTDDRLLTREEIEGVDAFVQILSFALMSAGLVVPRTEPSKAVSARTDLLEDILRISSAVVSERDLGRLSDMILTSLSSLFGFGKVTLVAYNESEGLFRWIALFGYDEDVAKEARSRSIPTDIVLEDLKESKRIGRSAYLTLAEDMSPRSRSYFVMPPDINVARDLSPRLKNEFRKGDCLAFGLRDAAGRIVGVIYPSEPKDGLIPDKDTIETIEIFTSLAEVAVENARLSHEREIALRTTSQRTEQLSRILDLVSGVMYVRNLEQMLDDLLKMLARLIGTKRMVLGVKHPELGVYRIEAVYGFSSKAIDGIKKMEYPIDSVDSIPDVGRTRDPRYVRWWTRLGRMTYYMPAESTISLLPEELCYYPEPELIRLPRAGRGFWHELDYMDTLIFDKDGIPIAYLETLKPRDDRIPDPETIEVIEIFAGLAGIAIENAKMFQEHIDSRREAELYTDVLSHDIKNFNQAILGYLDLVRMKVDKPEVLSMINKIGEQVMNTSWLASNVRTMSRVTFGDLELSRLDLGSVLLDCEKSVTQYYPGRTVVTREAIEKGVSYTMADELIRELFINILTNAVKYDMHEPVVIELSVQRKYEDDKKYWVVTISDHGMGIPDDTKPIIFDRFSKAPKKKGSGMGLHIVKTLAKRYNGKVWVEDRVQGDHSQGASFKVQLPAVE